MHVKTPFIVGGAVILVVVAAVAYLELRPVPAIVSAPPAAHAPAPAALPAPPPAPPQVAVQPPADCLLPGPPPVAPDGGKADAADMKLGHDVIQSFVVELEDYQACREKKIATAGSSVRNRPGAIRETPRSMKQPRSPLPSRRSSKSTTPNTRSHSRRHPRKRPESAGVTAPGRRMGSIWRRKPGLPYEHHEILQHRGNPQADAAE
jgi:hypothetical protein